MVLEILKFPDPRLRKKGAIAKEVTPALQELAKNMLETMYASHGIGLAAPQVGESLRLLVIDTRPMDEAGNLILDELTELERAVQQPITIFNPEVVVAKEKTTYDEGCLSVPGFYETVERAAYVEVKGLDINGNELLIKTDGLLAICLQHEMDHLEGKLFIDRLSFVKSNRIKNRIKKQGYPTLEEAREERERKRDARKLAEGAEADDEEAQL
jgi:peptide deformylase